MSLRSLYQEVLSVVGGCGAAVRGLLDVDGGEGTLHMDIGVDIGRDRETLGV